MLLLLLLQCVLRQWWRQLLFMSVAFLTGAMHTQSLHCNCKLALASLLLEQQLLLL